MGRDQKRRFSRHTMGAASGQSIVEAVVGMVVLVVFTLLLLDAATLIVCKFACDALATKAARVAADHEPGDDITPGQAANDAAERFPRSEIITAAKIDQGYPKTVEIDGQSDHIAVRASIRVRIPFAVPFLPNTVSFTSESIQPWIAKPADS